MQNSSAKTASASRAGFTLIELLVVIAIIAILASILFPVFGRARENARKSSCLSNLKQIGLGLMQYTQDYDENIPYSGYGYNVAGAPVSPNAYSSYKWADVIQPYIKSDQLFTCPSDTGPNAKFTSFPGAANTSRATNTSTGQPLGGSYSVNVTYGGNRPATPPSGQNLSVVVSPSTTIYAVESQSVPNNQLYWSNFWYDSPPVNKGTDPNVAGFNMDAAASTPFFGYRDGSGRSYYFYARHLMMGNALFCDGHAKSYRVEQLAAMRPNSAGKQVMYMWTCEED